MPEMLRRPLNSIYIHIPFCKDKCYYCSFVSLVNKNSKINEYIDKLKEEMNHNFSSYKKISINSVYIGGGTPSLLKPEQVKIILNTVIENSSVSDNAEITIEVNPGTIDYNYLNEIRSYGINRLSIGIQSFNDNILKLINRKHTAKEAIQAVEFAKQAGFKNISIDLIYGLPCQNSEIWKNTLEIAGNLDINHISAYGLKIEEGTRFAKNLPPDMPDEDISADMYISTTDALNKYGFKHYEISNFAKPGYESRHNLAYWKNEEYFGFGLSAHGYVDGIRYANTCDFEEYIQDPIKKLSVHKVTRQEMIEEAIFLGLRLIDGINIEKFNREYSINLLDTYKKTIEKYTDSGMLKIADGHLKLTINGILISNTILADFLQED